MSKHEQVSVATPRVQIPLGPQGCDLTCEVKDFSFDLALERWLKMHGNARSFGYYDGNSEQDFLEWLRMQCFVVDEKLNKVHLSNYSRPEPTSAKDAADEPAEMMGVVDQRDAKRTRTLRARRIG